MACVDFPSCDPVELDTYVDPNNEPINQLFVDEANGILCYMTGPTLQKWDISGAIPVHDSDVAIPFGPGAEDPFGQPALAWSGTTLFIFAFANILAEAGGTGTLYSYDALTSPPSLLDSLDFDSGGLEFGNAVGTLSVSGNLLYVKDGLVSGGVSVGEGYRVFDISNPASLSQVAEASWPIEPDAIVAAPRLSCFAFVADPTDETILYVMGSYIDEDEFFNPFAVPRFYKLDCSTPGSPAIDAFYSLDRDTQNFPNGHANIIYHEGFLYCNQNDLLVGPSAVQKKLGIYDTTPTLLSLTDIDGNANTSGQRLGMDVRDDTLFLNNDLTSLSDGQLELWDVSNKSVPIQCQAEAMPDHCRGGIFCGEAPDYILYAALNTGSGASDSDGVGSFVTFDATSCFPVSSPSVSPGAGDYVACRALGDFGGYLFVADEGEFELAIFNVSDPTNPTAVTTLALDHPPTDVDLLNSIVFVTAPPVIYAIAIDDILAPAIIESNASNDGEMVTMSGGFAWTSGPNATVEVFNLLEDEDDETAVNQIASLDAVSDGTSRLAFSKRKLIFADNSESSGMLWSKLVGGLQCHHIDAGDITADFAQFEFMRARHVILKGDLVSDTVIAYSYFQIGDKYIAWSTGDPENVVIAPVGSICLGGDGNLYKKATGSGNTGWTAV